MRNFIQFPKDAGKPKIIPKPKSNGLKLCDAEKHKRQLGSRMTKKQKRIWNRIKTEYKTTKKKILLQIIDSLRIRTERRKKCKKKNKSL